MNLVGTDPGRAEQMARRLGQRFWRLSALVDVVRAVVPGDPAQAGHIVAAAVDDVDRAVVMHLAGGIS